MASRLDKVSNSNLGSSGSSDMSIHIQYMTKVKQLLKYSRYVDDGAILVKNNEIIASGYACAPALVNKKETEKEKDKDKTSVDDALSSNSNAMTFKSAVFHDTTPIPAQPFCMFSSSSNEEIIPAVTNAIIQCARDGISCKDAELYIIKMPSKQVLSQIIGVGIRRIYVSDVLYLIKDDLDLLKQAGIEVIALMNVLDD